jgi:hypothetical protein
MQAVQNALVNYLNALAIGEVVSIGALYYEVMMLNITLTAPSFGVSSLLLGVQTAATTATFGSGSGTIVVASNTGITTGQLVAGAGIAPGTKVTFVTGTTITLTQPTISAETTSPVAFSTLGGADISMPNFYYAAEGDAANVSVVS